MPASIFGPGYCIKVSWRLPIAYKICMKNHRSLRQPDLFEDAVKFPPAAPATDFVARIRNELNGTLACVREAAALPWKDLTAATLAELRFNSIAGWLPEEEAGALRAAHRMEAISDIWDRGRPTTDANPHRAPLRERIGWQFRFIRAAELYGNG